MGTVTVDGDVTAGRITLNGGAGTGYTFTGWNTKADGTGTSYSAGANYSTNANATLYAEWRINTWAVTYNGNGSKDFSLEDHEAFVARALAEMPDSFVDGENYSWVSFPGGEHAYNCWALDLYNCLLAFFRFS